MTRSLGLLALCAAFALPTAPAQDLQGPFLKVTAFQVAKPEEGAVKGFVQRDGTTRITARVEIPGRSVVAFNLANSKLDSFTDDKNTDLIPTPVAGGVPPQAIQLGSAFGASTHNVIHFEAPNCPAKAATKVRIKGTVAVLVGKDEKEVEKKDLTAKTSIDLEFGTIKMQQPAKTTGFGSRNTTISYQGDKPFKSVTLLDADGKEITCHVSWSYRPGAVAATSSCRATFSVDKKLESCTIRLKYFDSVEEIKVPVDLEVGPGL